MFQKEKSLRTVTQPIGPHRKVIDGILHVQRTGCQWNMLSKEYGLSSTDHYRFQEWNILNIFEKMMDKFTEKSMMAVLYQLDMTIYR
ncbi:MAG TPA: transposase [Candidatus Nitrosocosmicus sp.]